MGRRQQGAAWIHRNGRAWKLPSGLEGGRRGSNETLWSWGQGQQMHNEGQAMGTGRWGASTWENATWGTLWLPI